MENSVVHKPENLQGSRKLEASKGKQEIQKNILLISPNFSPEPTGIGKVNGEMMNWLAKQGCNCSVLTAFPYYPQWKIQPPYTNGWFKKEVLIIPDTDKTITVYRCPFYIPAKPSGAKRMLQDFSYWFSMSLVAAKFILAGKKYDLVITIAPPFHLGYLGLMISKRTGGKLFYHIQDLQIEAAEELRMVPGKKLLNYFYRMEKKLLQKADFVGGISPNMVKKTKAKVDRDVIYFPNWVDTDSFHPLSNRNQLKEKWGFQPWDIVFLYSGAIGEKQGLENILFTAGDLSAKTNIKFVICGSGPYTEKLTRLSEKMRLTNISFLPVQDKDVFNEFLNMADYHLILQKGNASDLVMPSKLATILAVGGLSIVTTSPGTSLYNLYTENDIGYIVEPDNHVFLSKLISDLDADENNEQKRENARDYAITHLNIDNVMNEFMGKVLI